MVFGQYSVLSVLSSSLGVLVMKVLCFHIILHIWSYSRLLVKDFALSFRRLFDVIDAAIFRPYIVEVDALEDALYGALAPGSVGKDGGEGGPIRRFFGDADADDGDVDGAEMLEGMAHHDGLVLLGLFGQAPKDRLDLPVGKTYRRGQSS